MSAAAESLQPAATPSPRLIAGFAPRDLAVLVAFLLLTVWAIWATRELLDLKERRIVSVNLSRIITDFVAAESRNASSPELAAARTRAYLAATDSAMRSLSRDGATVLVSEAVVGNSVPDMTAAVAAAVNARVAQVTGVMSAAPAPTSATLPSAPAAPSSLSPFAAREPGDGN